MATNETTSQNAFIENWLPVWAVDSVAKSTTTILAYLNDPALKGIVGSMHGVNNRTTSPSMKVT